MTTDVEASPKQVAVATRPQGTDTPAAKRESKDQEAAGAIGGAESCCALPGSPASGVNDSVGATAFAPRFSMTIVVAMPPALSFAAYGTKIVLAPDASPSMLCAIKATSLSPFST